MTKTIRMTVAQASVKFLDNQYVSMDGEETKFVEGFFTIFGHGIAVGLGEALDTDPGQLRVLQGRNEQGMCHVATAFAKQSNRKKIIPCASSVGPGAANMVTACATATVNNIPLLVFPADTFASRQPDPVLQQLEQSNSLATTTNDAFKPVCKYWDRITRPEMILTALINAMRGLTDPAEMRRRIQELKTEIRKLGSVNVNAIEDFKNLSERYEFMKTQHDDLVEAEATLKKIIEELDEAMRKQFTEQFAKISQEFNQVFKQLFGGGKGTLELMDGEDVLEAGIRIIAQPPGKKLQNMMQLSGGEKALTAISLLFAIQNLKPSPFCLLDEIEAALDDSNVTRFAQYLHKLTKNTQFIVITHRRGTMTAADRLYGITMQEKGVSTLVSVDLLEDELTK